MLSQERHEFRVTRAVRVVLRRGLERDEARSQLGSVTMSDTTEIRGRCGHDWANLAVYAAGVLDEDEERAVEVQAAGCDACENELDEDRSAAALLHQLGATQLVQRVGCWSSWPPRGRRR
jgi:hypothetical protein